MIENSLSNNTTPTVIFSLVLVIEKHVHTASVTSQQCAVAEKVIGFQKITYHRERNQNCGTENEARAHTHQTARAPEDYHNGEISKALLSYIHTQLML